MPRTGHPSSRSHGQNLSFLSLLFVCSSKLLSTTLLTDSYQRRILTPCCSSNSGKRGWIPSPDLASALFHLSVLFFTLTTPAWSSFSWQRYGWCALLRSRCALRFRLSRRKHDANAIEHTYAIMKNMWEWAARVLLACKNDVGICWAEWMVSGCFTREELHKEARSWCKPRTKDCGIPSEGPALLVWILALSET